MKLTLEDISAKLSTPVKGNPLRIKFKYEDPLLDIIRKEARAEKYATTEGLKEYVKVKYHATLNCGKYGDINSITFKDEKEFIMFRLRA